MFILSKEKKEVIRVVHNSAEEMRDTIKELVKEGWSDNTRVSLSGCTISRQTIYQDEISYLKEKSPDIVIQYPDKNSMWDIHHYIYLTEHERTIEEVKK